MKILERVKTAIYSNHVVKVLSFAVILFALVGVIGFQSSYSVITTGSITGGSVFTFYHLFHPDEPVPTFEKITPPPTINTAFDDMNLLGFDEKQNVKLTDPLIVYLTTLHPSGTPVDTPPVGVTIPAGTYVSSHYVLFDPAINNPYPNWSLKGVAEFDSEVLGVIYSDSDLTASDYLGSPTTTYGSSGFRGLEIPVDGAWITSNPNEIEVSLGVYDDSDHLRIITIGTGPEFSFDSVIEKINEMDLHKGITNSLIAKIISASESADEGEIKEAINNLEAFVNQVNAQSGKKISEDQASELLECAQQLIDQLSE